MWRSYTFRYCFTLVQFYVKYICLHFHHINCLTNCDSSAGLWASPEWRSSNSGLQVGAIQIMERELGHTTGVKKISQTYLFSSASQASSWTQPSSAATWAPAAAASTVPMGYNPQSMGQNLLLQPPGASHAVFGCWFDQSDSLQDYSWWNLYVYLFLMPNFFRRLQPVPGAQSSKRWCCSRAQSRWRPWSQPRWRPSWSQSPGQTVVKKMRSSSVSSWFHRPWLLHATISFRHWRPNGTSYFWNRNQYPLSDVLGCSSPGQWNRSNTTKPTKTSILQTWLFGLLSANYMWPPQWSCCHKISKAFVLESRIEWFKIPRPASGKAPKRNICDRINHIYRDEMSQKSTISLWYVALCWL